MFLFVFLKAGNYNTSLKRKDRENACACAAVVQSYSYFIISQPIYFYKLFTLV